MAERNQPFLDELKEGAQLFHLKNTDLAKIVGVTATTIQRWMKGGKKGQPSNKHVEKFREWREARETGIAPRIHPIAGGLHPMAQTPVPGARPWPYVVDLMKHAREVWLVKRNRTFLAGPNSTVRNEIVRNMTERGISYHYVLSKSDVDAYSSFRRLWRYASKANVGTKLWHYFVDEETLGKIISSPVTGYVAIYYDDSSHARWQRECDLFLEVPVRAYFTIADRVDLKDQEREAEGSTGYLELTEDVLDRDWEPWRETLTQFASCADPEEVAR